VTSITFADISKAFDTVWVKALLYKLGKYGIKGDLLCWLTLKITISVLVGLNFNNHLFDHFFR
jgi:hypothetical protein